MLGPIAGTGSSRCDRRVGAFVANLIASLGAVAVGGGDVLLDARRCVLAGIVAIAATCAIGAGFVARLTSDGAVYELLISIHAVDVFVRARGERRR